MNNATSISMLGTGGSSVLVAFVFVVVSIDVFLGVVDTGEPTSFVFCEVMEEDWERLNMWEELNLARIHNLQGIVLLRPTLRCSRRRCRRILYLRFGFRSIR